ncbi:MAG: ribonuclease J [Chloroflexi bacterium]|nr:ribonuclease J [Chloroflexota bacterium]
MAASKLRIVALGGLGEIGRNMLVFEYDERLLIVDSGLMIPENDMLGVDIVIPDLSYVYERADQVVGVVVTHGHEDHTGALPYLLDRVQAPVYATRLTRGLIEVKLREAKLTGVDLHTIDPSDVVMLEPFCVEFFRVSHSIPDGVGLAISTPVGLVVHSGDFKFDHSPVDGRPTDFGRLAELGARGVLLLLSDSTNAESQGYTPSEQSLGETLARSIAQAQGRVLVATFASNISRLQQVMDIAAQHGRRVAVVGRSMVNNVRIARELGYLRASEDTLLSVEQLERLPDHEVVLICTGSQGEPTSALVRMGQGTFRSVSVRPGDTVIVSASPIPGNEEMVNRTLDNLCRLGADVFYDEVLDVHVSGHASQEEQKMMINIIRPQYFIPIHGEYRHLVLHAKHARQCGIPRERIFILETGDFLELDAAGGEVVDRAGGNYVFVDGLGIGDVRETVLDDRRHLSRNGFLIAVVAVDKYTGGLIGQPQIVTRGFIDEGESNGLLERARDEVAQVVGQGGTRSELVARIDNCLRRFARQETGRRPMIVPVVTRV